MKKFLFSLAVGLLSAVSASADEPKPATAPTPTPAVTATTTPSVVYSSSTSNTRRGLLGRLRARTNRGAEMTSVPSTGTVITTPSGGTSVPTPMPPAGGTTGGITKSGDGVVTASGTTTTTMPATTTMSTSTRTSTQRMGLMARLRARR